MFSLRPSLSVFVISLSFIYPRDARAGRHHHPPPAANVEVATVTQKDVPVL